MDSTPDLVIKFLLASLLCGVIGLEREIHHRHSGAGLRTHILVGLGSCLIVLTSFFLFDIYKDKTPVDPTRMVAAVVQGIGFLCGGAIIRGGVHVSGLTTAATLWIVSGIGMAVGAGQYRESVIVTLIVFFVLTTLRRFEKYLDQDIKINHKTKG